MKTNKPLLLIDASITIFQYYFSLPDHWFSREDQFPTAAVYGYTTFLIRLLSQEQPEYIAACFDESLDQCFRNEIYPDYKSSRVLPDELLAFQLEACKQVTELFGIKTFVSERYEADDLIGSLYQTAQAEAATIGILTRDKDLGQLIKRPQDFLWDFAKYNPAKGDISLRDSQVFSSDLEKKWGVKPEQFADFLALVGDSVDDIPGVKGIGNKTAASLLVHFENVETLINESSLIGELPIRGAKKLPDKIHIHRDQIVMAKKLATICCDIELIKDVNELSLQSCDIAILKEYFNAMGFPALSKRLVHLPNLKTTDK